MLDALKVYLSGAHKPLIEGLRHGGQAQHMRRALTAFGSGWRGIVGVTPELMHAIGASANSLGLAVSKDGVAFARQMTSDAAKIGKFGGRALNTKEIGHYRKMAEQFEHAEAWATKTGHDPVLINTTRKVDLRSTIRHERIHSAHYAGSNATDPWWQRQVQQAGSLETAIRKSTQWADSQVTSISDAYKDVRGLDRESEILAWGNQSNKRFFSEASDAGYKDPRTLAFNPKRASVSQNPVRPRLTFPLLSSVQSNLFRASAGSGATTSLSRALKQLTGSRVTRKSL